MKYFGKISRAEFGTVRDYPFLMGLQLDFTFDGGGVGDGGLHTVNINPDCKYDNEFERLQKQSNVLIDTARILKDAKVNHVSELKNKPVEVELESDTFKSFRVLKEVL